MFGVGTKKMLNLMILKILERYSDERRPLTQKRILELLDIEFGMKCDRRSVKSNLISLKEMGYDINIRRGVYIRRDFEEAELRILIDSVLFSKTLSQAQAKRLAPISSVPRLIIFVICQSFITPTINGLFSIWMFLTMPSAKNAKSLLSIIATVPT